MEISYLIAILAGFGVGFLISLTGMGGGAVMTPFLILVLKLDPILAVGTDLTFAAITKIFGGIQHRKEHNVSIRRVVYMACGSLPATILSSQYILRNTENRHLIEQTLPMILGITLILVSLVILARTFRILKARETEQSDVEWPHALALAAIGAIGGTLVGLTSVGGGTVIMALLLIFYSIPLKYMVGMDVVHGAVLAGVSALSYLFAGQVFWIVLGMLLIGSIPGAWLGARYVKRIDQRVIRTVLAALVIFAGVQLLMGLR